MYCYDEKHECGRKCVTTKADRIGRIPSEIASACLSRFEIPRVRTTMGTPLVCYIIWYLETYNYTRDYAYHESPIGLDLIERPMIINPIVDCPAKSEDVMEIRSAITFCHTKIIPFLNHPRCIVLPAFRDRDQFLSNVRPMTYFS